jgi:hypothetical protein
MNWLDCPPVPIAAIEYHIAIESKKKNVPDSGIIRSWTMRSNSYRRGRKIAKCLALTGRTFK